MKANPKPRQQKPPNWREGWLPIFRAAKEGRLPNRLAGVLEMMMCQCALRKYREERRTAGKS